MKNLKSLTYLLLVLLPILNSCSGSSNDYSPDNESTVSYMSKSGGLSSNDQTIPESSSKKLAQDPQENNNSDELIEKKIIKTADLTIEVKDIKEARFAIGEMLKKKNAYIADEKENNSDYQTSNMLVIRILSNGFDSLMNQICMIAKNVDSKNISIADVTEEFVDITARLKNKKEVEKQYQELLKKANTIDEILNVNEHLRLIREEIESKEGRLKFLESQVSYSTINLYIYQKSEKVYRGYGYKLVEGLEGGWKGILAFIIALSYAWPILIIIFALIWYIRRRRKKKHQG
jgi:hypothetical protein